MSDTIIAALLAALVPTVGGGLILWTRIATWKTAVDKEIESLRRTLKRLEEENKSVLVRLQEVGDGLGKQINELAKSQTQHLNAQTEQLNSLDREMIGRLSRLEAQVEMGANFRSALKEVIAAR